MIPQLSHDQVAVLTDENTDDLMQRLAAYREWLAAQENPLSDTIPADEYLKVTEQQESVIEKFDKTFTEVE